ncbi:MAG: YdeI/OmpD-associated family protein [Chitinophagales bacterium]|nr:YdeI/OmpD-associated family protein [Chitinophagales bacterium]
MSISEIEHYYPKTKEQWRNWLAKNHVHKDAVWLIMYKQSTNKPSVTWSDAVDEALCFGWIDSIKKTLDEERTIQFFSKRKPNSTWSKINKQKVSILIEKGLMTHAGLACIQIAKQNGSWCILDSVEALEIPADLKEALTAHANAMNFFLSLSKSTKKALLQWIVLAKRAETREKRIQEVATLASKQQKPKQF